VCGVGASGRGRGCGGHAGFPVAVEAVLQPQRRDHVEEIADGVARRVGVDRVGWAEAQVSLPTAQVADTLSRMLFTPWLS
jgi:hypothetical protein